MNNMNREKNDELSQKRQRHLNQCINAFETRLRSIAVGRWRDQVSSFQQKE
jgi:predicted component of type VI protein secretion system